jgi:hypothetical protein
LTCDAALRPMLVILDDVLAVPEPWTFDRF